MAFKITVVEIRPPTSTAEIASAVEIPCYEQRVETLDMRRLIDAVNFKPQVRKARETAASK